MATSVCATSCLRAEGKERGGRYEGTFEGYQNPELVIMLGKAFSGESDEFGTVVLDIPKGLSLIHI